MPVQEETGEGIAIIGLAGRFPGAGNVAQYWNNLCEGLESVTFFSKDELRQAGVSESELKHPDYVGARGVLGDIASFDAEFFGFTPREAEITDPQQRLFMECAWEALESANCPPDTYKGSIGVYGGTGFSNYMLMLSSSREVRESAGKFQIEIGNDKDFLCTRTSYKLNLCGPSVNINTACSTSLVATVLACQGLRNYDCDVAIAGGVSINVPQETGYIYEKGSIQSPDGHCRAFDAKAGGTVAGNGVSIVVLKRLKDAVADGDEIVATIKGFAVNNDGALKVGFTAPSIEGQAKVICEAIAHAGVSPETISYVEAHGTGTSLGDPIEVEALTRAFRFGTARKQFCAIGSVKTNIGHLDAAAGVAGLIKASLAIKHGFIPASLHYDQPNAQIDLANSPFFVSSQGTKWKQGFTPRRAGVSSFGIGGTNSHVVLEEAPRPWTSSTSRETQLLVVSARGAAALEQSSRNLYQHLEATNLSKLPDVAHTLAVGRKHFQHRLAIVSDSRGDLIRHSRFEKDIWKVQGRADGNGRPVAMLISGQGGQYLHMGRDLYAKERIFREEVERGASYLKPLVGADLREIMFAEGSYKTTAAGLLRQTSITQPALCLFELALLKQWESWGVKPDAMLGHSLGELVAATVAGVMSQETALGLAALRGRLMSQTRAGAMTSALISEDEAREFETSGISIAAINARQHVVFSGGVPQIEDLENRLRQKRIATKRLEVDSAFHSELMEDIRGEFLNYARRIKLNRPCQKYISGVSGTFAGEEVTNPEYWWAQIRQPVQFLRGIRELAATGEWIWLEIGPGELLSRLVRSELRAASRKEIAVSSLGGPNEKDKEQEYMVRAVGTLWTSGVQIDWNGYYKDERRRRVSLPTYPFQRQKYWISQTKRFDQGVEAAPSIEQRQAPDSKEREIETSANGVATVPVPTTPASVGTLTEALLVIWKELLGITQIAIDESFFDLGGHSLLAIQMVRRMRDRYRLEIPLEAFLEEPTISGLIRRMSSSNGRKRTFLAPITTTGTKPPFFGVHPIGGGAFSYRPLALRLGSGQPFYGFQALELAEIGEEGDPYASLREMAATYLGELLAVQSDGPYALGGLSWGGILAFEMAQQLMKAGKEVRLLALFDTPAPSELAKLAHLTDEQTLVGLARDLAFQQDIELPLTVDDVRALGPEQQLTRVLLELQRYNLLSGEMNTHFLRQHLLGYRSRLRLVRAYEADVYPGKITLFRSTGVDQVMTPSLDALDVGYRASTFGWDRLSTEKIEVYFVPGNHSQMMNEPYVEVLSTHLKSCLYRSLFCTA